MAAGGRGVAARLPGEERPSEGAFPEEIPYGLRISEDSKRLELDTREHQVLVHMMALAVQDFPFSSIASDLNEKGFRTRDGRPWSPVSVFNMLPRLIEIGPGSFLPRNGRRFGNASPQHLTSHSPVGGHQGSSAAGHHIRAPWACRQSHCAAWRILHGGTIVYRSKERSGERAFPCRGCVFRPVRMPGIR